MDNLTPLQVSLDAAIRGKQTLIQLQGGDELRVLDEVQGLCQGLGLTRLMWSSTRGLLNGEGRALTGSTDAAAALHLFEDRLERHLGVFCDLGELLSERNPAGPATARSLKDAAQRAPYKGNAIVLLDAEERLPASVRDLAKFLDVPLPLPNQLLKVLVEEVEPAFHAARRPLNLDDEGREALCRAGRGFSSSEFMKAVFEAATRSTRAEGSPTAPDLVRQVVALKRDLIRKRGAGALEYYDASDLTLDVIGGLRKLKAWLIQRAAAFSPQARTFGLEPPNGVMIIGPQGCGKSLAAKATAALLRRPLLALDAGMLYNSFLGKTEQNARQVTRTAEALEGVLWIDECEKLFQHGSAEVDGGTSGRVLGHWLTWSAEQNSVFIVATANDVKRLPPEFARKGRFDDCFFVDLPGPEERAEIFAIHLARRGRNPAKFTTTALSDATDGFSGAEIEAAVKEGLFAAFHEGIELTDHHILREVEKTHPLSVTRAEELQALRDWARTRARPAS